MYVICLDNGDLFTGMVGTLWISKVFLLCCSLYLTLICFVKYKFAIFLLRRFTVRCYFILLHQDILFNQILMSIVCEAYSQFSNLVICWLTNSDLSTAKQHAIMTFLLQILFLVFQFRTINAIIFFLNCSKSAISMVNWKTFLWCFAVL